MLSTLAIDGAIMAIVQDVIEKSEDNPSILSKFRDELANPHDGISPRRVAIRALNSVYSTNIPEGGGEGLRPYINDILEKRVGKRHQGTLTLGIDIDVGFLDLLAQVGPNRLELLKDISPA